MGMAEIKIEHNPNEGKLRELGVQNWPIWEKEESEFPWYYDEPETCYILEGEVIVTPEGGEPVRIQNPEQECRVAIGGRAPGELPIEPAHNLRR